MKTIYTVAAMPKIPEVTRTAAYTRVSGGTDAMHQSLFAQISHYQDLIAARLDWQFAGVYADEATTGTKDNRAEFQQLLSDCRAGKIDLVITKSITRFARNTVTTLEVVRELKALGINVYFEKENVHSMSGDGELMLSILASYAQEESLSVSENCKWRIRKMFAEGRPNTGRLLGYRLLDGQFYIVPSEAEIVRQIFADYLTGMGTTAIAKKLNDSGIKPPHAVLWKHNTIHKILRNEKYAGDMLLQKTFQSDHISKKKRINHGELPMYHIERSHEPIIDRATFQAVQAEAERRALVYPFKQPLTKYPFAGMIRCGKCGAPFGRKQTAIGTKYNKVTWLCDTSNTLGQTACASQRIPEDILLTKTAEVLGLITFDEAVFRERIDAVRVPAHNRLCFVFKDGHSVEVEWQHKSRRESWTPEMKQAAREREQKRIAERSAKC
jgi:DNA invertase Pin-like site-specific DNA recombinase